jgi:Zn finger protein HypA/HybF involved in hydrogenase expression
MQEDSLVKNLISTLETAVKTMDARRVTRVRVKLALGPQELQTRQVEEIFLRLSRGTIAEGARLEIDEVFDAEAEALLIEEADLVGPVTNDLGGEASQPPG